MSLTLSPSPSTLWEFYFLSNELPACGVNDLTELLLLCTQARLAKKIFLFHNSFFSFLNNRIGS